jgi:hypothetical protein
MVGGTNSNFRDTTVLAGRNDDGGCAALAEFDAVLLCAVRSRDRSRGAEDCLAMSSPLENALTLAINIPRFGTQTELPNTNQRDS